MLYLVKQMIFLANCMAVSGVISIPSLLDPPVTTWAWDGCPWQQVHSEKELPQQTHPPSPQATLPLELKPLFGESVLFVNYCC